MQNIRAFLLALLGRLGVSFGVNVSQKWDVECREWFHADGQRCCTTHNLCPLDHPTWRLKWATSVTNLVPTVMLNKYLDATLKTGLAAPAWYVGLVNNAGFSAYAAGDVMDDHAGWTEGVPYSNLTRPALTLGAIAAGSVDNSAARATYNINASMTLRGGFLCDDSTKSGTTGILGGEADFTGGNKAVADGDTVYVTVTATMTSA